MQRTKEVYTQMDAILIKEPGIKGYNGVAGFSLFTRTSASYTGFGFIGLKPWDERKGPNMTSQAILKRLNGQFSRIIEARVFCVAPPSIPGISPAGGFSKMLQDRSVWCGVFLARKV